MKISKVLFAFALVFVLPLTANAATIVFDSVIDGAQANAGAGTGSSAVGNASMTFDTDTNLFSWFIGWQDLNSPVTLIHFHGPAAPGADAPPVITVFDPASAPGLTNPEIGSAALTPMQAADLMANLWYINIHTEAFRGGEIRGQVTGGPGLPNPVVPLPATAWLFLSGLAGLLIVKRTSTFNSV